MTVRLVPIYPSITMSTLPIPAWAAALLAFWLVPSEISANETMAPPVGVTIDATLSEDGSRITGKVELSITNDANTAEDTVQDVFVRLAESAATIKPKHVNRIP